MQPTVGLMMIVRNEAPTLPRLAKTVIDQVDHWTLLDTGSGDNTIEVAQLLFRNLPGQIITEAWTGFGPSRNSVLAIARPHTDWLLAMDADETLEGRIDRSELSADLDAITPEYHNGPITYWLPRLISASTDWQWKGRTHEHLHHPNGPSRTRRTDRWSIRHHADGGNRTNKYHRDVKLLRDDWTEHPNPRTAFYLARTYEDLGQHRDAIRWYRTRLQLSQQQDEETWYTHWRLGATLLNTGEPDQGRRHLHQATQSRPWRAEPLVTLSEHHRQQQQWTESWSACQQAFTATAAAPCGQGPKPTTDTLFIDTDTYTWRIAYEASITAYYVAQPKQGARLCHYLLTLADLPQPIRDATTNNLTYYPRRL